MYIKVMSAVLTANSLYWICCLCRNLPMHRSHNVYCRENNDGVDGKGLVKKIFKLLGQQNLIIIKKYLEPLLPASHAHNMMVLHEHKYFLGKGRFLKVSRQASYRKKGWKALSWIKMVLWGWVGFPLSFSWNSVKFWDPGFGEKTLKTPDLVHGS